MPEIVSALIRRLREKTVSKTDYLTLKARLLDEVRDAEIVNITDEVVARSLQLLEQSPLRAMDALHLAGALAWQADLFVTADKAQAHAAQRQELKSRCIV